MPNGTSRRSNDVRETSVEVNSQEESVAEEDSPTSKDVPHGDKSSALTMTETYVRLEALVNERAALREEVAQVRRSLEEIQGKHEEELGGIREQLVDTQGEKVQAETQYRNLLGKVNTIKSQLGERLKADAVGVHLSQLVCRLQSYRKSCRRRGFG